MTNISNFILTICLATSVLMLNSCSDNDENFGIFSFQDENTAVMNGDIQTKTPTHWNSYMAAYPNTNMLILKDCPGSMDDEANLVVARTMRQQGLSMHLPAAAEIASGAVDLYIAGVNRTREAGSKIGVHAWSDGSSEATDYPVGHENHLPYINFYAEMGFSQEAAEAFYYFTINAAAANDIHWMTEAEILQYNVSTP